MPLAIQNVYLKVIKNAQPNLPLLICIVMNILKDYVTIYLWLIQGDVLEVVILLMPSLIKYVFQTKQKIYI